MKTRLCKSKRCVEGRLFTVNTHHSPFASVKPMFSDTISNVKSCILRRVRKLRRAVVHCFDYDKHADIMLKVAHRHVFVSEKKYTQPSFSARIRTRTRLVVDTLRGSMLVEHNIGNCVTNCMQTRASMRTFSCENIRVSQKVV